MRTLTVSVERDRDGWLVSNIEELPGCHTQGKTAEELIEMTKDALDCYLDVPESCMLRFVPMGLAKKYFGACTVLHDPPPQIHR